MGNQILYDLLNWGSAALVVAAIVAGVVLTNGTVRTLLAAALLLEVLGQTAHWLVPSSIYFAGDTAVFAYSLAQTILSIAPVVVLVIAAVVGVRQVAAKDAALAALTDVTPETWRQPETSPDPRLLAD
jgi:hypothetical protein